MQFDYFEGSYNISYRLGCFFDLLAFTLLDYVIEKYLYQKTRFLFTIYGIIISSFQILAMAEILTQPIDIADYLHMYGLFPLLLLPFLLYIYVFRKSTGELRRHAILIILGMIIYLVAQVGFSLLNTIGLLEDLLQKNLKASVSIIGALLCGGFLIANSSSKTLS
jgi:putative effector of murein hydrolase